MIRNLIKLSVLGGVVICALNVASSTINEMVIEVHKREKTIADAIIKQQVQEMFKEAEKEIEKVQEETKIEIKKEEVVIKPPLPEKPKKEEPKKEVAKEEETAPKEEVEVAEVEEEKDALVDGAASDAVLDVSTYYTLSEEDMLYVGNYLVEHYFLFGYEYYQAETDPIRYERKKLASDMEDQVISSLNEGFLLIKDLKGIDAKKLQPIVENAHTLAENFKETYKGVGDKGEEFKQIYDSVNGFFDTYVGALDKAQSTFTTLNETTNKALVLPMLLKSLNQDVLPSVKEVLNQGFALKEQTNKIYVEGLDASFLISPEEVMEVIENPYSILPPKETAPPAGTVQEGIPQEETLENTSSLEENEVKED